MTYVSYLLYGVLRLAYQYYENSLLLLLRETEPHTRLEISINYLRHGNLCTHFVNLKTFSHCRCAPRLTPPKGPSIRPWPGGGHSQFVRIPQVCLHFRWFVVIAQCNLCDRRGKVNVDVPEREKIVYSRDRREREGGTSSPSANRQCWRQTRKTVYLRKCISRQ